MSVTTASFKAFSTAYIVAMLCLAATTAFAAPYKWVDSNGQTHYSQIPPTNKKAQEVEVEVSKPSPVKDKNAQSSENSKEVEELQDKAEKIRLAKVAERRKENCIDTKHNLMVLENNSHVREKVDGEFKVLSEEERQARISRFTKQIEDLCQ